MMNRLRSASILILLFCIVTAAATAGPGEPIAPRQVTSLDGDWLFQQDKASEWKTVHVPSSFQSHEGTNFHGIVWYKKTLPPIVVPHGERLLVHFQAAATQAEVWWDGQLLGSHLGGWTPFRFDVTDLVRRAPKAKAHVLLVKLDELVGHNTQGFLPVIAPHFGGLWQEVSLLLVPETYIDDLQLLTVGDAHSGELRVSVPLAGTAVAAINRVGLRYRLHGEERWLETAPSTKVAPHTLELRAPIAGVRLWSPAEPNLYELELSLPGPDGDVVRARAAFRSLEAFGPELRLNGAPLNIRGLLNWGYSGPLNAPNPGEEVWRRELEQARACGFNLMKFCLWIPPKRYLELADELGMLTWMEYPTWHPTFTCKYLEPLRKEFREFFEYDRNHPSVMLRSLTCETGPSADLQVTKTLYNEAHEMIPGALVEDDSSWIGWNRVSDFYDDHPYGNNHTWGKTLDGFKEYVLGHGLKPLVLGESISADTWLDRPALLAHFGTTRPWWAPAPLDDSGRWLERMRALAGEAGLEQLRADSLNYGMLMRKYQIETYRRELPYGGYVISVIRDFPKASMGLIDYLGRPKWDPGDWAWQGDTMCLLKTQADRRSFGSGSVLKAQVLLSHFGLKSIQDAQLTVELLNPAGGATPLQRLQDKVTQNPGTLAGVAELEWPLPNVDSPTRLLLKAEVKSKRDDIHNEWPLWIVPTNRPQILPTVQVHRSVPGELRQELFPDFADYEEATAQAANTQGSETVLVASHFDDNLVHFLEGGGKVLLLPDGKEQSFALSEHWFLRGGPYIPQQNLPPQVPRELLVELQHFDLAGPVVPNLPQLDSFDPILLLWDTHDQDTVQTHGIIFETRVGKGRLLVSAARHSGAYNSAGRWLLGVLLERLRSAQPPRHALTGEVWAYLKERLHADQTNLVSRAWKFKPDPKTEGLNQGWQSPGLTSEADWKDLRIGTWWELQGYPDLDGWAWYRLWVDIPRDWQGRQVYLSFEGVDDMYELYVNGKLAGKGGDLATHKDALNEKKSHNITEFVSPAQKALIAVRVYDWYGYGGIFRPVTLGTLPFRPALDLLK